MHIPELFSAIQSLPPVMHLEIGGERYQKTFRHTFSAGIDAQQVTAELLGNLCVPLAIVEKQCQPLYQFANGMRLFHSETDKDDSGKYFIPSLTFYPLEQLASKTAYMQSQVFQATHRGEDSPIYSEGLVVGEAMGTGNPLVLVRWGALAGKLAYADQDPDDGNWQDKPFAQSLADLLTQIALPPYAGLCNLCGAEKIWFE